MPPRTSAGQGRIMFGVATGSDVAAAAGALVDVDDQDDEAVLVAEQQKQQKEKTQPVLFTEERPRDVGIGKASCVFKGTTLSFDVWKIIYLFKHTPSHMVSNISTITQMSLKHPVFEGQYQPKKTLKSHANSLSHAIRLCPYPQRKIACGAGLRRLREASVFK